MTVTIYHNPRCSKSRETLALLQEKGINPKIVLYLDTPPDTDTLQQLLSQLGLSSPRDLARTKESLYKELGLAQATDAQLLTAMSQHPKLIERPIVIHNGKAALGRPPEQILTIL